MRNRLTWTRWKVEFIEILCVWMEWIAVRRKNTTSPLPTLYCCRVIQLVLKSRHYRIRVFLRLRSLGIESSACVCATWKKANHFPKSHNVVYFKLVLLCSSRLILYLCCFAGVVNFKLKVEICFSLLPKAIDNKHFSLFSVLPSRLRLRFHFHFRFAGRNGERRFWLYVCM